MSQQLRGAKTQVTDGKSNLANWITVSTNYEIYFNECGFLLGQVIVWDVTCIWCKKMTFEGLKTRIIQKHCCFDLLVIFIVYVILTSFYLSSILGIILQETFLPDTRLNFKWIIPTITERMPMCPNAVNHKLNMFMFTYVYL